MLKLKYLVLSLSLLIILHAVNAEDQKKSKFLSCNAANATAEVTGCPKGANCIENGTVNGALQAFCVCGANATVNENYSANDTKSQYCIEKDEKSKFLSCNAASSTAAVTGCPKGASCIENGTVNGSLQAFCVCGSNAIVNENYTASDPKSQYCIEKAEPASPKPTPKPTTKPEPTESPTKEETKSETKNSESDKNDVKIAPAPESHHLIGGIILPIAMVLAFIGVVFAVRKYNLVDRAHGYIRGRNQATRYNGLMENDFDDDPLLI